MLAVSFLISAGYIGKLKLQIPVRYIKSQPWVVQIDQLYIIAGPPQTGDVSWWIYHTSVSKRTLNI